MAQLKVLVVEDSPTQQLKTRLPLLNAGYEVVVAANGEEGYQAALASKPSVILLDMVMPVCDGPGMLAKIKETPELRDIPVIMLTATSESESIMNAISMGAKDYIVKPFSIEVFEQKLTKFFRHLNPNLSQTERIAAEIDRKIIRYDEHEGAHLFEVKPDNMKLGLKLVFSYIRRFLASGERNFVIDFSSYPSLPDEAMTTLVACMSSLQKGSEIVRFIVTNPKVQGQLQSEPDTAYVGILRSRKEVVRHGF